jgi:hypothetical protein
MDMLFLQDVILHKQRQPPLVETQDWRKAYELD